MRALLKIHMVELAFVQETEVVLFCNAEYPQSVSRYKTKIGPRRREGRRTFRSWADGLQTRAHPPPRLRGKNGTGVHSNTRLAGAVR